MGFFRNYNINNSGCDNGVCLPQIDHIKKIQRKSGEENRVNDFEAHFMEQLRMWLYFFEEIKLCFVWGMFRFWEIHVDLLPGDKNQNSANKIGKKAFCMYSVKLNNHNFTSQSLVKNAKLSYYICFIQILCLCFGLRSKGLK